MPVELANVNNYLKFPAQVCKHHHVDALIISPGFTVVENHYLMSFEELNCLLIEECMSLSKRQLSFVQ